jgi:hypothetical protein
MKRFLFFILLCFAPIIYGQTFLNGDFENNSVTNCMINNITNQQFNTLMNDVKGIGLAETLDIFYDTNCPAYSSAQSGHYFVSLENNSSDSTQSTAISLKLSNALQVGEIYSLSFYVKGGGPIVIGVSDTDSSFGSVIYTSPTVVNFWTLRTITFTAPLTGEYVTVKYGSFLGGALVDNFIIYSGLGIDGQTGIEKLKIFPNPFSNQITFTSSTNELSTISLYDLLGKQILQQSFSNSTTINTEQLENGIYFYELENSKRILGKGKVVKN